MNIIINFGTIFQIHILPPKNVRYTTDCNNCDKLNHLIDKEIAFKK